MGELTARAEVDVEVEVDVDVESRGAEGPDSPLEWGLNSGDIVFGVLGLESRGRFSGT
jgi:hypothetical protein